MISRRKLEDLRMRFFTAMKRLPPALAARLTRIDDDRETALVAHAVNGRNDGLRGGGRLHADPDRQRADGAVMTRSDVDGRGLGLRLVQEIVAEVLAENERMPTMDERPGFRRSARTTDQPTTRCST